MAWMIFSLPWGVVRGAGGMIQGENKLPFNIVYNILIYKNILICKKQITVFWQCLVNIIYLVLSRNEKAGGGAAADFLGVKTGKGGIHRLSCRQTGKG
jgi:hypothetical protein